MKNVRVGVYPSPYYLKCLYTSFVCNNPWVIEITKSCRTYGKKSHIIIDIFLIAIIPLYTVHEMNMKHIMVNPIYNIETNALLSLLTDDPYGRGGLTLNEIIAIIDTVHNYTTTWWTAKERFQYTF